MEQLRRILSTIQENLGKLSVSHKLLIGSLAVILVMTLFLVSQYAGTAKMVELLPGASADAQQQAQAYLVGSGLPFSNKDGKLLVPAERQLAIIAALGEAGRLPEDSALTFRNVVESQNWMNPKSLNDQIFNTALENTLAQCIKKFRGIESATVVIDAPPPSGLGAAVRKPTASVIVFTRGGAALDPGTVSSIAATIASAKAGMEAKNVNISDGTTGRHYSAQDGQDFAATTYMEHVAKYELYVRTKLQEHLAYIRGASIAVNAQVDVRRTESRTRTIKPKGQGSEALTSKESTTTSATKEASESAAPGLQSNARMDINQGGAGSGSSDTKEMGETEYSTAFGMTEQATIDPRGMATRVNAAIGVPRDYIVALWQQANPTVTTAPTEADLKTVFEAEKARLESDVGPLLETDARPMLEGGEAVKPGTVVVSMIPVPLGLAEAVGGVGGATKAGGLGAIGTLAMGGWVKTAALGALAVISLAMMMLMVRKASKPVAMPSAAELVGIPPALATGSDLVGEAEEGDTAMLGIEVDDETLKTQKMLEEVTQMVQDKPSETAALFNRWVQTDH